MELRNELHFHDFARGGRPSLRVCARLSWACCRAAEPPPRQARGVTASPTVHDQLRLLKAYTTASLSAPAIAMRSCLRRFSSQGQVMSAQTAPTMTTSART
jgi:hypothetical protein